VADWGSSDFSTPRALEETLRNEANTSGSQEQNSRSEVKNGENERKRGEVDVENVTKDVEMHQNEAKSDGNDGQSSKNDAKPFEIGPGNPFFGLDEEQREFMTTMIGPPEKYSNEAKPKRLFR